ncbi:unnamed protein product, partial [Mesorhabditis spiculigera]
MQLSTPALNSHRSRWQERRQPQWRNQQDLEKYTTALPPHCKLVISCSPRSRRRGPRGIQQDRLGGKILGFFF